MEDLIEENIRLREKLLKVERAKQQLRDVSDELALTRHKLSRLESIDAGEVHQPKWAKLSKKRKRAWHGTPVAMLSDTHWDEVVRPEEIGFVNAHNRTIAEQRLVRFRDKIVQITRDQLSGLTYDGLVLALGGDLISGHIHDELVQTNAATTMETVLHWSGLLAQLISDLADEFGQLYIPSVVGNHGRNTRKSRAKLRALDSFDWLLVRSAVRQLDGDDRITWNVPEDADCRFDVYSLRFLLTHGDQVRGGGGIGGIWPPVMRMRSRKLEAYTAVDNEFDCMLLGHWHQCTFGPGGSFVINGSTKGRDEFSHISGFGYEPPQQAFFLVTPEHGITTFSPVLVGDRQAEGW